MIPLYWDTGCAPTPLHSAAFQPHCSTLQSQVEHPMAIAHGVVWVDSPGFWVLGMVLSEGTAEYFVAKVLPWDWIWGPSCSALV